MSRSRAFIGAAAILALAMDPAFNRQGYAERTNFTAPHGNVFGSRGCNMAMHNAKAAAKRHAAAKMARASRKRNRRRA